MTEPIITILLENGLILLIYDESKKIAGDRWHISLTARIEISTNQIQFTSLDLEKRPEVIQTIGGQINFEKKLIRNFVADNEKEEIVSELCESFLKNTRSYLSHQQFAERFALKCYADSLEKRKWVNS